VRLAGAVGKSLEWYDFAVYGFFAPIFAEQFFPSADRLTSAMSYAVKRSDPAVQVAYVLFAAGESALQCLGAVEKPNPKEPA